VPRTGRRRGAGGTREKILVAARAHFGETGYDGATIRGIAAVAGVDPALIPHYFGSKEGVFKAAVEFPIDPAEFIPRLLEPGVDGLGERLVLFFLETWDSPVGASLLGLIRSVVSSDLAADIMREFVTREVLGRIAAAIKLDHPQLRASLVATQLVGLAMLRYVIRVQALKNASRKELARWIGPNIQRYLTEPMTALSGGSGKGGGNESRRLLRG
jgi:AcrR family transcriptional regulator